MKILVFDTETSGLPFEKNSSIYDTNKWPYILQLSYVIYNLTTNLIELRYNTYVKISPEVEITKDSEKIHGITREKCDKGKLIHEVLYEFKNNMIECDLLIGHNVSFDKRMLIVEGIRNKINLNLITTYCTMKNSVELCKIEKINYENKTYLKYPTLNELYFYLFNINPKKLHNAYIDVLVCLKCYLMMEKKINVTTVNRELRLFFRNIIN